MSNSEEITRPIPDLTGFPTFVFVIEGKVAYVMVIPSIDEHKVAVFSSNPEIHILEGGFPADGNVPRIDTQWPV